MLNVSIGILYCIKKNMSREPTENYFFGNINGFKRIQVPL